MGIRLVILAILMLYELKVSQELMERSIGAFRWIRGLWRRKSILEVSMEVCLWLARLAFSLVSHLALPRENT